MGSDEQTLRQIEEEQKRKLKRKEVNEMILENCRRFYFVVEVHFENEFMENKNIN